MLEVIPRFVILNSSARSKAHCQLTIKITGVGKSVDRHLDLALIDRDSRPQTHKPPTLTSAGAETFGAANSFAECLLDNIASEERMLQ